MMSAFCLKVVTYDCSETKNMFFFVVVFFQISENTSNSMPFWSLVLLNLEVHLGQFL